MWQKSQDSKFGAETSLTSDAAATEFVRLLVETGAVETMSETIIVSHSWNQKE